MIKYRTSYGAKVEAVKILRETPKTVVFSGIITGDEIREAKRSNYINWHDSWEDAHSFLMEEAQWKIDGLRLQLERAKGELGNIKGMKKP